MPDELIGPFEDQAQFTDYKTSRERRPPPVRVELEMRSGEIFAREIPVTSHPQAAPPMGVIAGGAAAGAAIGAVTAGPAGAAVGGAVGAVLGVALKTGPAPVTGGHIAGGPYIASDPTALLGKTVGSGQCVAYVQAAAAAPQTTRWRRGDRVKGQASIEPGTAIATFDADGTYGNHTDGRSHAAIYLGQDSHELTVMDQWSGQVVHQKPIRFGGHDAANDGNRFYVIV